MKRFLVKSRFVKTFMAVPVLCLTIACEDVTGYKDSPVDGYVSPKNFSVSGCKSTTRGLFEDETIEYKARENGLLRITHNNAIFNCVPGRIYAELIEKGQTFIIEEIEEESNANCVCPYDLGYDIGPLTEGEEYSVSIRRGKSEESEVAKFIFTYSPTVKGQISRK